MEFLADKAPAVGITWGQLIAILLPIVAIQVGLVAAALVKMRKVPENELRGTRLFWTILLALCLFEYPLGLFGPIAFFVFGRKPVARD
ncbi:MAG: hypothetical protein ACYC1U_06400 [Candidatus Aquicultorales bacterium]